jgi:hypothetical protein
MYRREKSIKNPDKIFLCVEPSRNLAPNSDSLLPGNFITMKASNAVLNTLFAISKLSAALRTFSNVCTYKV